MAIRDDLKDQTGVQRRLYLKIDGVEEVFWQNTEHLPEADSKPLRPGFTPGPHPILPSTIGVWRFNDIGGTGNPEDDTVNDFTLTEVGSVGHSNEVSRGPFLDAKYFARLNSEEFNVDSFTLSAWIVPSASQQNNANIIGKGSNYTIGFDASGGQTPRAYLLFDDATSSTLDSDADMTADALGLVTATWDGTTHCLYVNGELKASATPGKTIAKTTNFFILGRSLASNEYYDGTINDAALYPFALTASEVRYLYRNIETRPGINCLRPPSEFTSSLHPTEFDVQQSAMTFSLDDVHDPKNPTKSLFARLFSPGSASLSANNSTWVRRHSTTAGQLDADATTIAVQENSGFDTKGIAYIGNEAFSYTGKSTVAVGSETLDTFTGVTKGLYPAINNSSVGKTYIYPRLNTEKMAGDKFSDILISEKPMVFTGKRVALYMTCWDKADGNWHSNAAALLQWTGKIANVTFNRDTVSWNITCDSVMGELERPIAADMPETELRGVYLGGKEAERTLYLGLRTKVAKSVVGGGGGTYKETIEYTMKITLDSGFYNVEKGIILKITDYLNNGTWTEKGASSPIPASIKITPLYLNADGYAELWITNDHTEDVAFFIDSDEIFRKSKENKYPQADLLEVLGVTVDDPTKSFKIRAEAGSRQAYQFPHPVAESYQMHTTSTSRAYTNDVDDFVIGQGDNTNDASYISIGKQLFQISGTGGWSGFTPTWFDLKEYPKHWLPFALKKRFSTIQRYGEETIRLKQVYIIDGRSDTDTMSIPDRGPFEMLLYSLLSSGTTDYNDSTYDKLPARISTLGIPAEIVDVDSFLRMDAEFETKNSNIGDRSSYKVDDIPWIELWQREAKLFGAFLCWKNGKLTAVSGVDADNEVAVTLSDSTNVSPVGHPEISYGTEFVKNEYICEIDYDHNEEKYKNRYVIRDVHSEAINGFRGTLKIQHPGVKTVTNFYTAFAHEYVNLEGHFSERQDVARFPWQKVTVTLAPNLIGQIYIGDVVLYQNDTHPSPFGTGTIGISAYARIIDLAWDYKTFTGTATLYVNCIYDNLLKRPYAGCAATDDTAANAGWTDATNTMVLKTDEFRNYGPVSEGVGATWVSDDGVRFVSGDKLLIRERNPSNVIDGSGVTWNVVAAADYNATSNSIQFNAVTLTGFDNTGATEYILTPRDYSGVEDSQKVDNCFIADESDGLLNATDIPNKWG